MKRRPPAFKWMSVQEVADLCGCSAQLVYKELRRGSLRYEKRRGPRGAYLIARRDAKQWIRAWHAHATD